MEPDAPTLHEAARTPPPGWVQRAQPLLGTLASAGVFDPTIAPQLVAWGFLPQPARTAAPDPAASWRDVELDASRVRFHRRLWLDFGGIAKGCAVDAALEAMAVPDQVEACVAGRERTRWVGPHLNGRRRRATPLDRFASVVAPRCAVADALTKVALAAGADAAPTCARFGATAHLFSRSTGGWHTVGGKA